MNEGKNIIFIFSLSININRYLNIDIFIKNFVWIFELRYMNYIKNSKKLYGWNLLGFIVFLL